MFLKLIDNKIRKAFSDSAMQYEVFASLQREIGRELIKKIAYKENCSNILDVGMGTGYLTYKLHNLFPEAMVIGVDFASGMVQYAKEKYEGFEIVQADAEALPFRENVFDVIVSNLVYQWVADLQDSFQCCFSSLKEKGEFYMTMFGHNTLNELFVSLEKSSEKLKNEELAVKRLVAQNTIVEMIRTVGFKDIRINAEIIKLHFVDLWELILWLKKIGANVIEKDIYVGRDWLSRANDYYQQNFKDRWGISATFEVLWVEAKK